MASLFSPSTSVVVTCLVMVTPAGLPHQLQAREEVQVSALLCALQEDVWPVLPGPPLCRGLYCQGRELQGRLHRHTQHQTLPRLGAAHSLRLWPRRELAEQARHRSPHTVRQRQTKIVCVSLWYPFYPYGDYLQMFLLIDPNTMNDKRE